MTEVEYKMIAKKAYSKPTLAKLPGPPAFDDDPQPLQRIHIDGVMTFIRDDDYPNAAIEGVIELGEASEITIEWGDRPSRSMTLPKGSMVAMESRLDFTEKPPAPYTLIHINGGGAYATQYAERWKGFRRELPDGTAPRDEPDRLDQTRCGSVTVDMKMDSMNLDFQQFTDMLMANVGRMMGVDYETMRKALYPGMDMSRPSDHDRAAMVDVAETEFVKFDRIIVPGFGEFRNDAKRGRVHGDVRIHRPFQIETGDGRVIQLARGSQVLFEPVDAVNANNDSIGTATRVTVDAVFASGKACRLYSQVWDGFAFDACDDDEVAVWVDRGDDFKPHVEANLPNDPELIAEIVEKFKKEMKDKSAQIIAGQHSDGAIYEMFKSVRIGEAKLEPGDSFTIDGAKAIKSDGVGVLTGADLYEFCVASISDVLCVPVDEVRAALDALTPKPSEDNVARGLAFKPTIPSR